MLLIVPLLPGAAQSAAQQHPFRAEQKQVQGKENGQRPPRDMDLMPHKEHAEQHRHIQDTGPPEPGQLPQQPGLPERAVQAEGGIGEQMHRHQHPGQYQVLGKGNADRAPGQRIKAQPKGDGQRRKMISPSKPHSGG